MKPDQKKTIATACALLFGAYQSASREARAEVSAFAKVLKAAPLNDADWVKNFKATLFATFGEKHADAAQKRLNIVNNARRIVHGGTKDDKPVRGKGMPALVAILDEAQTLKDLRTMLADAVPAGLKGKSGGKRTKPGKPGKPGKSPISVPQVATQEEAYAAARNVLEFCRDKFTKPSETARTEAINKAIAALTL